MSNLSDAKDEIVRIALQQRDRVSKRSWREIGRPEQFRPEGCERFVLIGGRGSGKTRAGAEDCIERVLTGVTRVHILAPTFADARDVCVEGESGLLKCAPAGFVKKWNRSMGELEFSTGAKGKIFAACEPDRLNGPQCGHLWADEFGLYYDTGAIDMALLGLRLGSSVSSCWTSTPKLTQSTKYVLNLDGAVIHRMRMRDNMENLAPGVVDRLEKRYAGTRLGRSELDGEVVEGIDGALWTPDMIDPYRVPKLPPNVVKIAVGVDPSVSDPERKKNPHKDMDECGIVVAGVSEDYHGFVLNDLSLTASPGDWARVAVGAYHHYRAAVISAEGNQGGELVRGVILGLSPNANVRIVHATIGKRARAEPLSALYEQGRIHHVASGGSWSQLRALEDEQCSWDASDPSMPSPNRVDALVWAFEALGLVHAGGYRETQSIRTSTTYSRFARRGDED
jgi:phage terminase large subunit-like protein